MKRQVILMLLILVCSWPLARAGQITMGVYADPAGTSCNMMDNQPGLLTVYVMLSAPDGAIAVQLAAPKPACMDATWLSDTDPWGMIFGTSQTGFAYGFGGCYSGFFHIGVSINYFVHGTTEPCCLYPVLADPSLPSGMIEVWDCNNQVAYAWGEVSTVNGNSSCPCGYPVAVEETTWGKVKSLFAE